MGPVVQVVQVVQVVLADWLSSSLVAADVAAAADSQLSSHQLLLGVQNLMKKGLYEVIMNIKLKKCQIVPSCVGKAHVQ